ncbi:cation:proton antiporter [Micromonospora chokoriensis]|uniref:cation:proton antiporter n=1 Tax=Micromonospora chokoriensis TaxID=356851 RepID=UPI0004C3D3E7|nr:sodium:proton antiporter [Micromonospora chokoriensis]
MELLILAGVFATATIAVTTAFGPRWGVAAPLLLVLIGIVVSTIPGVPPIEVDPELVLAGVLPPLLYSSAVSMPAMNFRREFNAIGGLAVLLVVVSSLLLGAVFDWIFPDLGFAWGVALGAILSPTDAVAITIARRVGVSHRITTILEGESLLNDATALVVLRTAVAAAALTFSFWEAVGQFLWSVLVAVVVGGLVGALVVRLRAGFPDVTASTLISFTVPFLAAVPATLLHGSGLVAAVMAGIVTGRSGPHHLPADQRLSDYNNWRTVTVFLEGAIFLLMGLEMSALVADASVGTTGLPLVALLAILAVVVLLAVRSAYVFPLIGVLRWDAHRARKSQSHLRDTVQAIAARNAEAVLRSLRRARGAGPSVARRAAPRFSEGRWHRLGQRARLMLNDIDYVLRQPLSWRDGVVMVVAGMRGAVTVAAAQTLPEETPHRAELILLAFTVALLSLLVQGGSLVPVVRWVRPSTPDVADQRRQQVALEAALAEVTTPPEQESGGELRHRLALIQLRRERLLDLQDEGVYDATVLEKTLTSLDTAEVGLRLKLRNQPDW